MAGGVKRRRCPAPGCPGWGAAVAALLGGRGGEGGEEETADEIQDELGGVTPEQSHSVAICRSRG